MARSPETARDIAASLALLGESRHVRAKRTGLVIGPHMGHLT
jgi:hypothetical protein